MALLILKNLLHGGVDCRKIDQVISSFTNAFSTAIHIKHELQLSTSDNGRGLLCIVLGTAQISIISTCKNPECFNLNDLFPSLASRTLHCHLTLYCLFIF